MEVWIALACLIVLACISATVAARKGRSVFLWGIYGAVLAPIALPHAILIPYRGERSWRPHRFGLPGRRIHCPQCGASVLSEAVVCRQCRQPLESWLAESPSTTPVKTKDGYRAAANHSNRAFVPPADFRQRAFDWDSNGDRMAGGNTDHSRGPMQHQHTPGDPPPPNPDAFAGEWERAVRHPHYPYAPETTGTHWPRLMPFIGAVAFGALAVAAIAWPDRIGFDDGLRESTPSVSPMTPVPPRDEATRASPPDTVPESLPQSTPTVPTQPPEPAVAAAPEPGAETEPSPKITEPFSENQPGPPPATVPSDEASPPPEMAPPPPKPVVQARLKDDKTVDFTAMVANIARETVPRSPSLPKAAAPSTVTASGELVVMVQQRLRTRGYDCGNIDGRVGPATAKQIRAFQRDNEMTPTGQVDYELMRRLGIVGEKIDAFRTNLESPKVQ